MIDYGMYELNLFRSITSFFALSIRIIAATGFLLLTILRSQAQDGRFVGSLEGTAGYVKPAAVPFWFRSNTWGNIPASGLSSGLKGGLFREYGNNEIFNWGGGIETGLNMGRDGSFNLIQGYAKLKIAQFQIKAGRFSEISGLCDTVLSTGSFAISGNAPGIPSVQLGIPEYINFPLLNGLVALKGSYSHGWLGKTATHLSGSTGVETTWFHQKALYIRIGRPGWLLKLYGGFNHQVFWGNERWIFGSDYTLTNLETYFYVISGKDYVTQTIEPSRIGNHLGSVDLGAEFEFRDFRMLIYRQNFYDFIALKYLANISDGLNGISIINKSRKHSFFRLNRLVAEFMYSKDQGSSYSRRDPSYYNENYYNNYIYSDGWSYKGYNLGNPLFTSKMNLKEGLSDEDYDYFHNNRVAALHLGVEGTIGRMVITFKSTYSRNFGTYFTSFDAVSDQFSGFLEFNREFKNNTGIGFRSALDIGDLLQKSYGMLLFLHQSF